VVKADAYGLGLAPSCALCSRKAARLFRRHRGEGERARAIAREAAIYVFDGLAPGTAPRLKAAALRPALNSMAEIAEWAGSGLPAALHFDTGMNAWGSRRGGGGGGASDKALSRHEPFRLLAEARRSAQRQPDRGARRRARAFSGRSGVDLQFSGIFLPQKPLLELTRPGFALYGGNPAPGLANPMRAVARLQARILSTREIAPGGERRL